MIAVTAIVLEIAQLSNFGFLLIFKIRYFETYEKVRTSIYEIRGSVVI